MKKAEIRRIDDISRAINDLLKGRRPRRIAVAAQPADEIRQLSTFVNDLADALEAATSSVLDLSEGRLRAEINCALALGGGAQEPPSRTLPSDVASPAGHQG